MRPCTIEGWLKFLYPHLPLYGTDFLPFPAHNPSTRLAASPHCLLPLAPVVGGGTLSLAYSFAKAGSVVGILVLALICVATDFSLFAMVSASRRTGQKSYEGVMKAGTWA
ncbi:Amino acid transporter, transmembrane, partial [Nannochloropsis gaditana]